MCVRKKEPITEPLRVPRVFQWQTLRVPHPFSSVKVANISKGKFIYPSFFASHALNFAVDYPDETIVLNDF